VIGLHDKAPSSSLVKRENAAVELSGSGKDIIDALLVVAVPSSTSALPTRRSGFKSTTAASTVRRSSQSVVRALMVISPPATHSLAISDIETGKTTYCPVFRRTGDEQSAPHPIPNPKYPQTQLARWRRAGGGETLLWSVLIPVVGPVRLVALLSGSPRLAGNAWRTVHYGCWNACRGRRAGSNLQATGQAKF
jgi:hypothetical protein